MVEYEEEIVVVGLCVEFYWFVVNGCVEWDEFVYVVEVLVVMWGILVMLFDFVGVGIEC